MAAALTAKERKSRLARIKRMAGKGKSKKDIAEALDISPSALRQFLSKYAPELKEAIPKAKPRRPELPVPVPGTGRVHASKATATDRAAARAREKGLDVPGPDIIPDDFSDLEGHGFGHLKPGVPARGGKAPEPPKAPKPSAFTEDLKREFLIELMGGRSVRQICMDDRFPHRQRLYESLLDDAEFADNYARAREVSADQKFDYILEIADDGSNDWMETERGYVLNKEHVQRSKLRIDSLKWYLAREMPKKYGEEVHVKVSDVTERPIEEDDSAEEAAEKYAAARNFDY